MEKISCIFSKKRYTKQRLIRMIIIDQLKLA